MKQPGWKKNKRKTYHKGAVILCVVWAHCSSSFPSIIAWCRSCWWWIHIYYDLVKRMTKKNQHIKGGQKKRPFGPLLIIFPLRPDMASVVMVVAAISMT